VLVSGDEENPSPHAADLLKREAMTVGVARSTALCSNSRLYLRIIINRPCACQVVAGMDLVDEVRRRGLDATVVVMTASKARTLPSKP